MQVTRLPQMLTGPACVASGKWDERCAPDRHERVVPPPFGWYVSLLSDRPGSLLKRAIVDKMAGEGNLAAVRRGPSEDASSEKRPGYPSAWTARGAAQQTYAKHEPTAQCNRSPGMRGGTDSLGKRELQPSFSHPGRVRSFFTTGRTIFRASQFPHQRSSPRHFVQESATLLSPG